MLELGITDCGLVVSIVIWLQHTVLNIMMVCLGRLWYVVAWYDLIYKYIYIYSYKVAQAYTYDYCL